MIEESYRKAPTLWLRLRRFIRLGFLCLVLTWVLRGQPANTDRAGLISATVAPYRFNYVAWEIETLWEKFKQFFFGYQVYIPVEQHNQVVLDYLQLVGQIADLDAQLEALYMAEDNQGVTQTEEALRQQRARLYEREQELQPLAEPLIEQQVSVVLMEAGFSFLGQVLPPVSFRFVEPPDVLIISPRHIIRQDFAISLRSLDLEERAALEARIESISPTDAAYITDVGGVGIWPAMVVETRHPAIAFEIVGHEWSHHYLAAFPLGFNYFTSPETRIINETTATVFGNAVALRVLQKFYADEIAAGMMWIPDYPTLEDFQLAPPSLPEAFVDSDSFHPLADSSEWDVYRRRARYTTDFLLGIGQNDAAQQTLDTWENTRRRRGISSYIDVDGRATLDRAREINRTRLSVDYLLSLEKIDAAESYMQSRRQLLGMRVLNQAWFAFNGGYQAEPGQGGGVALGVSDVTDPAYAGDPTGPAVHEMLALAPDLYQFLEAMRAVTTRAELINALLAARERWKNNE